MSVWICEWGGFSKMSKKGPMKKADSSVISAISDLLFPSKHVIYVSIRMECTQVWELHYSSGTGLFEDYWLWAFLVMHKMYTESIDWVSLQNSFSGQTFSLNIYIFVSLRLHWRDCGQHVKLKTNLPEPTRPAPRIHQPHRQHLLHKPQSIIWGCVQRSSTIQVCRRFQAKFLSLTAQFRLFSIQTQFRFFV